MTLESVPRDDALERVSTAYAAAPTPIQRAVRTGSASTHREVKTAGELVSRGGNYYVVRLAERVDAPGGERILKYFLLGGGVGLLLVLSGQRRRVETEARGYGGEGGKRR